MRQTMILAALLTCFACGKKDSDPDTTTTTALSFSTDINPILTTSCGTSSCHGSGSTNTIFVDNEANFKASTAKSRLSIGDMPPADSTQKTSFTTANKDKLTQFLSQ